MIEIKEGPELDRAVAEAIGLTSTGQARFRPSTVLKDAFSAAELSELFPGRWLGTLVTGWTIMELETMNVVGPDKGCSTPALAICAAILKVEALKRT